jgi:hypothetical protein
VLFLLVFLVEGYTGHLFWGATFLVCLWRVFYGRAFFMSSLESDLYSSARSFMTCASLWQRLLEISGFGGRLLQMEVPDEGACLQFTHAAAGYSFFPTPIFVWFLFGFFIFIFCSRFAFVMLNCYWIICWHSS